MDITIQVVIIAPSHDLSSEPQKNDRRVIYGDVIGVFVPSTLATFSNNEWIPIDEIGSPRCGFIFITDIPDGVTSIERIREVLSRSNITYTNIPEKRPTPIINNLKEWNINISAMSPPTRNALTGNKYITISFTQLRAWCFSKQTSNAIDMTDFII